MDNKRKPHTLLSVEKDMNFPETALTVLKAAQGLHMFVSVFDIKNAVMHLRSVLSTAL